MSIVSKKPREKNDEEPLINCVKYYKGVKGGEDWEPTVDWTRRASGRRSFAA